MVLHVWEEVDAGVNAWHHNLEQLQGGAGKEVVPALNADGRLEVTLPSFSSPRTFLSFLPFRFSLVAMTESLIVGKLRRITAGAIGSALPLESLTRLACR